MRATPTFTSGYYGDVIEDYMNFTVREGMIGGTISTALKDHESLTMTLDVGEGYFAGRYASWSSGWVETALVIVFSVLALLYWALTLRSRPLRVSSRTAPPDAAAPSDLPYLLAGGAPDFNMLICHWAALGYLTIEMDEKGHVLFAPAGHHGQRTQAAGIQDFLGAVFPGRNLRRREPSL